MKYHLLFYLLQLLISSILFSQSRFEDDKWSFIDSRRGIDFFENLSTEDTIILGCRFKTEMTAQDFLNTLRNVEEYTRWISGIDSVRRVPRPWQTDSTFSYQFYVEYWFLKKDGVANLTLSRKSPSHYTSRSVLSRDEFITERYDRVNAYRITWDFYEKPTGNVIEYTGILDLPVWVYEIITPYILSSAEKTMNNLSGVSE